MEAERRVAARLAEMADRLDSLAEMAELMDDAAGATRFRDAGARCRNDAMALLDDLEQELQQEPGHEQGDEPAGGAPAG